MTTGTLALIILVAILAQVGVAAAIGIHRRGGQSRNLAADAPAPTVPTNSPSFSELRIGRGSGISVQRRDFEDQSRTICSFYLVPCDGKPLPPFQAGRF
ncbi:MAG: hypothetical protein R3E46_14725 [Sedimenticolaceae bacterium]